MFKKLLGKKIILDAYQKAEVARGKVEKAFSLFTDAHKTLQQANEHLKEAIEEHEKNILAHEAKLHSENNQKQKVIDEINANNALADKLKEFIPQ